MRDPDRATAVANQLREGFLLTPTEAAIAANLAGGQSLSRIAGAYGVGLGTVRSHLKKSLTKTGTNRQAEVVVLIARSVAPVVGWC